MFYDHQVGRKLHWKLQLAAANLERSDGATRAFSLMADDYISFLRDHIAKGKDRLLRSASWKRSAEDKTLQRLFSYCVRKEEISETARESTVGIDDILAELSIVVPPRPAGRTRGARYPTTGEGTRGLSPSDMVPFASDASS